MHPRRRVSGVKQMRGAVAGQASAAGVPPQHPVGSAGTALVPNATNTANSIGGGHERVDRVLFPN